MTATSAEQNEARGEGVSKQDFQSQYGMYISKLKCKRKRGYAPRHCCNGNVDESATPHPDSMDEHEAKLMMRDDKYLKISWLKKHFTKKIFGHLH